MKKGKFIYVSAAALMLSSCMAMDSFITPDADNQMSRPSISGTVCSDDELPIEHIMVTASWGSDLHDDVVYTSSEGKFNIPIHEEIIGKESTITLTLEDIDGIENGGAFEKITDQIMLFSEDENYTSDSISLDYQLTRATREENSQQS